MSRTSTVAVTLAGLAVVLAATGTAVAVTVSHVFISDGVTPSHTARVDAGGHLTTIEPSANYSYSGLLGTTSGDNFVTRPTTAGLSITSVSLSSPSLLIGTANTEVRIYLFKATSSSSSSCVPTVYEQLAAWNVAPGDDIDTGSAAPFTVRSTGGRPYCLSLYANVTSGSGYGGNFLPFGAVSWYVSSGTYAGPVTNAKQQLSPAQVRRAATRRGDR